MQARPRLPRGRLRDARYRRDACSCDSARGVDSAGRFDAAGRFDTTPGFDPAGRLDTAPGFDSAGGTGAAALLHPQPRLSLRPHLLERSMRLVD